MKFSIVTPTFNSGKFLHETIQSVIAQKGEFSIEYIIVDNWSQDNTIEIVKHYQKMIEEKRYLINCNRIEIRYLQEKDDSMYEAINKGLSLASGDIYAWINSDDIYLAGAFNTIVRAFEKYPEIKWIKGITSYINEDSEISKIGTCFMYDQSWLRKGIYGRDAYFVQQDSVFWHSELWKYAGGIDPRFKRAGDYYLWMKFSQFAPLYSIKAYISCFRRVKDQLSEEFEAYIQEYDLMPQSKEHAVLRYMIRSYLSYENKLYFYFLKKFLYRVAFGKQKLLLLELCKDGELELKEMSYYVAS